MDRTLTIAAQAPGTLQEDCLAQERLGELFDAHHARLYRLARRLSRDPEGARDLVQEAFLRAAGRPRSLPGTTAGDEAWLIRTLVNLCRDRARRERVRSRAGGWEAALPTSDPESVAVARASVEAALARLPPRRRAVIVLHELEERPVAEIAAILGVSRVTVRWHLSAGRKDLRRLLGAPGRTQGS